MMELNKIYNENCLDTMKRMDDNFIDLVITSPPYNMRNRIRNGQYATREKADHFSKKYKYFEDYMPIDKFYNFHFKALKEMIRVSKIVCYNFQIVTGSKEAFFQMIGDFKNEIKDIIIWDKINGQPAMHENILNSSYELILVLENDNRKGRLIQGAKFKRGTMSNILRIPREVNKNKTHSASFPKNLVSKIMEAFSNKDDIIYDPFIGTGTTAIVSHILKRKWIGSEICKEYFLETNKNIELILSQKTIFESE